MSRPVDNTPAGVILRQTKVTTDNAKRLKAFATLGAMPDEATIAAIQRSLTVQQNMLDIIKAAAEASR